jgi:hypothetical protein
MLNSHAKTSLICLPTIMCLRDALIVSVLFLLCSTGCTGSSKTNPSSSQKVGMHIDAMLEFAMEYPLSWTKTRQQNRAAGWGVVRWADPEHPEVKLSVSSKSVPPPVVPEHHVDQLVTELPGFEFSSRETTFLQDVSSLHVLGYTPQLTYDIHLLSSQNRLFIVMFSAPPDLFDAYQSALRESLDSFTILENYNGSG